jgi:hypothetical protein
LVEPEHLLGALEREYSGEQNEQLLSQAEFIQKQIDELSVDDEKLYKAYMAGVFDEHEYAGRRQMLKQNNQILVQELNKIRSSLMSPEEF